MDYPKQVEANAPELSSPTRRTVFTLVVLAIMLALSAYCLLSFWGSSNVVESEAGAPIAPRPAPIQPADSPPPPAGPRGVEP